MRTRAPRPDFPSGRFCARFCAKMPIFLAKMQDFSCQNAGFFLKKLKIFLAKMQD